VGFAVWWKEALALPLAFMQCLSAYSSQANFEVCFVASK